MSLINPALRPALCALVALNMFVSFASADTKSPSISHNQQSAEGALTSTGCESIGDVNLDGVVNIIDLVAILSYLYYDGAAPVNPLLADWDDYEMITMRDVVYFEEGFFFFHALGPQLKCPPSNPAYFEPLDQSIELRYRSRIRPNVTSTVLTLQIKNAEDILAFNLPLRIRVNGNVPTIDSVKFTDILEGARWILWPEHLLRIVEADGIVLIAGWGLKHQSTPIEAGVHWLANLYLSFPSSPAPSDVVIDFKAISPRQPLPGGYPDTSLYALVIGVGPVIGSGAGGSGEGGLLAEGYLPQYTPITVGVSSCCEIPGDANSDSKMNIADITFGIARIFAGGAAPSCQDQADANGDNTYNISDITYSIGRIFAGGAEPVCGLTE